MLTSSLQAYNFASYTAFCPPPPTLPHSVWTRPLSTSMMVQQKCVPAHSTPLPSHMNTQ
jgi:hypothetical protein